MKGSKYCGGCEQMKALVAFSKNRVKKDGRNTQCRDCRRAYYEAHRDRTKMAARAWYRRNRSHRLKTEAAYRAAHKNKR